MNITNDKDVCRQAERRFLNLLKDALYVGLFGYGGPAVLVLAKQRLVEKKHIISEKDFMDALALSQALPGATGVNLMGYIGYKTNDLWGAILVPFMFVMPSFISITLFSWAYFRFGNLPFVKSIFSGLGALVVALLVNASFQIGKSVFGRITYRDYKGFIISAFTFAGLYFFHFGVIWLILFSGLVGFIFFYFTDKTEDILPQREETSGINDASPAFTAPKNHIKRYIPLAALVFVFALACLLSPPVIDITCTFFKIGMLGFGGGFAAIPLIKGIVVDQLNWVDKIQFRDGIALGQITPGPVFITASFIGYHVAGILGAFMAVLAVFTPSVAAIVALSGIHSRVSSLKFVRVVIKGFLSGFFGLLMAVTLQFGLSSLMDWKTWTVFALALLYLFLLKKDTIWLIIGTIVVSLLFI